MSKQRRTPGILFRPNDVVVCLATHWSTLSYGREYIVTDSHIRQGAEYITINHPRFGPSNYNAEHFRLTSKQEKSSMYIAINLKDHKLEDMSPFELVRHERVVAQDSSLDRIKDVIRQHIASNPNDRVAIFALHSIAEIQAAPVLFRNMRV